MDLKLDSQLANFCSKLGFTVGETLLNALATSCESITSFPEINYLKSVFVVDNFETIDLRNLLLS